MITDSRQQQLDSIDIIETALQETGSQFNLQQGVAAVLAQAHAPNTVVIREGNTLFLVHYLPDQPDHALFHVLNADTATNYIQNTVDFLRAAGAMGMRVMVVRFETPEPLTLFKKIMRDPPFANMGYTIQQSPQGQYQATINMGDTKGPA
jgi:hypothetical protein